MTAINTKSSALKGSWAENEFKNMDSGIFNDLRDQGKTFDMHLEEVKSNKENSATAYYGKTPVEVFKIKRAYEKAGKVAPETALESVLRDAQIKVHGGWTDKCRKFFEHSDTDVLFPPVLSNMVGSSLLKASLVPDFVYQENVIDGKSYEKLFLEDTAYDRQLREVSKMAELPETVIKTADHVIRPDKYGRYLRMPVEDIMDQSVNALGKFMEKMGMQIGIDQTNLMVYRLINGDGNSNTTAGTTVESDTTTSISFGDTIDFSRGAPSPYQIDKIMGRKTILNQWLKRLYDGTTTSVGNDKFNAFPQQYEWDETTLTADILLGVDSRYAIELISRGAPEMNEEDIIRRTSKGFAVHAFYEFAIGDNQAVVIFDRDHA